MRTPFLAVAGPAVYIAIRAVAADDRVELFGAIVALVALAMPLATLRQDLLSGVNYTTAARTTFSGPGLDDRRVNDGHQWSHASARRGRRRRKGRVEK